MSAGTETTEIGPRDIVFDCPICQKSLVVDEVAEGLTVECPRCGGAVIVPPKQRKAEETPPAPPPAGADPRLFALISKLRELQTQRAEINANIIARLNDINRQMVLLTRLENTHQQLLQEWNRVLAELRPPNASPDQSQANVTS